MLVHLVCTGQQLLEDVGAAGDGDRDTGGRPQRVAATDPVPEAQDLAGRHAIALGRLGVGGDADDVAQGGVAAGAGRQQPGDGGLGVGQGLAGGEGLGDDQEGGGGRVEPRQVAGQVGRVDVGDEAHVGTAGSGQGIGDQARTEVRAADADADQGGERLAAEALQLAIAEPVGQFADALALLAGQAGRLLIALATAQGGMQCGTLFGRVDDVAGKELLAGFGQAGAGGHADQGVDDAAVDALLAEVGDQAGGLERQLPGAVGLLEQRAQRDVGQAPAFALQDAPGGAAHADGGAAAGRGGDLLVIHDESLRAGRVGWAGDETIHR